MKKQYAQLTFTMNNGQQYSSKERADDPAKLVMSTINYLSKTDFVRIYNSGNDVTLLNKLNLENVDIKFTMEEDK